TIGKPVGENPRGVDVVRCTQCVDQIRDESDVLLQTVVAQLRPPDSDSFAADSRRVDDYESRIIRHRVPPTYVSLCCAPQSRAVHADDERRWLRTVVAPRHIEQIFPFFPLG